MATRETDGGEGRDLDRPHHQRRYWGQPRTQMFRARRAMLRELSCVMPCGKSSRGVTPPLTPSANCPSRRSGWRQNQRRSKNTSLRGWLQRLRAREGCIGRHGPTGCGGSTKTEAFAFAEGDAKGWASSLLHQWNPVRFTPDLFLLTHSDANSPSPTHPPRAPTRYPRTREAVTTTASAVPA